MNTNNSNSDNNSNNMEISDEEFFAQPSLTRITCNNYYNSLCFADVVCLLQEDSEEENDDEESEEEEEDLSLYERKRCVVENEDIPMDISDSDSEDDDDDELPDVPCLQRMDSCNYELAPRRLFPELDEDEDEEPESYTCLHGVSMTSRDPTVCDECNELQEAAEVAEDIPMDISDSDSDSDDDLLLLSKPIKIQRQNTICGLNIATGYAIYNGNPNGDRLLEDEDEV